MATVLTIPSLPRIFSPFQNALYPSAQQQLYTWRKVRGRKHWPPYPAMPAWARVVSLYKGPLQRTFRVWDETFYSPDCDHDHDYAVVVPERREQSRWRALIWHDDRHSSRSNLICLAFYLMSCFVHVDRSEAREDQTHPFIRRQLLMYENGI